MSGPDGSRRGDPTAATDGGPTTAEETPTAEATTDESDSLRARVGERLSDRGETLAVAESCTGGLVGSLVTDVPGASDYFDRSVVTYSYDAKRDLLAIPREALDEHGAVSEPVARAMARAVRDTADATWGVATTGVAGPTGGSESTPVGTAFVGVAYAAPWGSGASATRVARYEFDGDRAAVKRSVAERALADLLAAIRDRDGSGADGPSGDPSA